MLTTQALNHGLVLEKKCIGSLNSIKKLGEEKNNKKTANKKCEKSF